MSDIFKGDYGLPLEYPFVDEDGNPLDLSNVSNVYIDISCKGETTRHEAAIQEPKTAGIVAYHLTKDDLPFGDTIYQIQFFIIFNDTPELGKHSPIFEIYVGNPLYKEPVV